MRLLTVDKFDLPEVNALASALKIATESWDFDDEYDYLENVSKKISSGRFGECSS